MRPGLLCGCLAQRGEETACGKRLGGSMETGRWRAWAGVTQVKESVWDSAVVMLAPVLV